MGLLKQFGKWRKYWSQKKNNILATIKFAVCKCFQILSFFFLAWRKLKASEEINA